MRYSFLLLLLFITGAVVATVKPYQINGKLVGSLKGKYAYLQIKKTVAGQTSSFRQAIIKNNEFVFSGQVEEVATDPTTASLFICDQPGLTGKDIVPLMKSVKYDWREIIVEPSVSIVIGSSVRDAVVEGSLQNTINNEFQRIYVSETKHHDEIKANFISRVKEAGSNKEEISRLKGLESAEHRELQSKTFQERLSTVRKYPQSGISVRWLWILASQNEMYGGKYQAEIEAAWEATPDHLKKHFLSKQIISKLSEARKKMQLGPGVMIPDHVFTYDGGSVSMKSLRGKYVLLDFWTSWCGPCRAEHYEMKKLYTAYKSNGFDILQVSLDNKKEAWLKALKEDQLPWQNLRNETGWDKKIQEIFFFNSVPTNFLIGPDGVIIARDVKGAELRKALEKIFSK